MRWILLREVAHEPDAAHDGRPWSTWEPTGEVFDDGDGLLSVSDEIERRQAADELCLGATAA